MTPTFPSSFYSQESFIKQKITTSRARNDVRPQRDFRRAETAVSLERLLTRMEAHALYAAAHACSLARGMHAFSKLIKAAKA
jgi:hypothetical protein